MKIKNHLSLKPVTLLWASFAILVLLASGVLSRQTPEKIAISSFAIVMLAYLMEGKLAGCGCGVIYATLMTWVFYSETIASLQVIFLEIQFV